VTEPFAHETQPPLDYDLHGIIGIRALGASQGDAAALEHRLGPPSAPLERDPDVLVRFVRGLRLDDPLTYLGGDVAATTDRLVLLRGRGERRPAVVVDLRRLGSQTVIVCDRDHGSLDVLLPLVNLTALAKGVLPLHAAAFSWRGAGVVAAGWPSGGKTSVLLGFLADGASFISDDWVYVASDGTLFGLRQPLRLSTRHARDVPLLAVPDHRRRLRSLRAVASIEATVPKRADGAAGATIARSLRAVGRTLAFDVDPLQLAGGDRALRGKADRLFLVCRHDASDIRIEAADPAETVRRLCALLEHERLPFTAAALKFEYAFPQVEAPLLRDPGSLEQRLLEPLVAGTPSFTVRHPPATPARVLFEAMRGYCG
jgi:hypothetical protein